MLKFTYIIRKYYYMNSLLLLIFISLSLCNSDGEIYTENQIKPEINELNQEAPKIPPPLVLFNLLNTYYHIIISRALAIKKRKNKILRLPSKLVKI